MHVCISDHVMLPSLIVYCIYFHYLTRCFSHHAVIRYSGIFFSVITKCGLQYTVGSEKKLKGSLFCHLGTFTTWMLSVVCSSRSYTVIVFAIILVMAVTEIVQQLLQAVLT